MRYLNTPVFLAILHIEAESEALVSGQARVVNVDLYQQVTQRD